MVFASIVFIFAFLPAFLFCDGLGRLTGRRTGAGTRNAFLFASSLAFYAYGDIWHVLILLLMGVFNYGAGALLASRKRACMAEIKGGGHNLLILLIFCNVALLLYYKYAYWLVGLVLDRPDLQAPALPLGISFFTFHAVSYLVDIWRGDTKPAKNAIDFLAYFTMFPHLVAGPIVRYAQVADDLGRRGPDRELFAFGLHRFLLGLNKKVLIANTAAPMADKAFELAGTGHLVFADAWLGLLAYAVQIYFDFSGYSDMAIGLAAMAGFHFEENFRRPYAAANMRDFWRRWHISLSSWLRDYVYIPLGGSRQGHFATSRNLLLVFFLCGLWHGADVTFVLWGIWHGLFLVLERNATFAQLLERLPGVLSRLYVAFAVLVGWCLFRAENWDSATEYLAILFSPALQAPLLLWFKASLLAVVIGLIICLLPDRFVRVPSAKEAGRNPSSFAWQSHALHIVLAVFSCSLLMSQARNPFIYFNF